MIKTLKNIQKEVNRIKTLEYFDEIHAEEAKLYHSVLELIATGVTEKAPALAREALRTRKTT